MIEGEGVALYARVSSDGQARDNTIASQVAALRERVAADGFRLMPDHAYVDEGYSGTILLRPACGLVRCLQQLRFENDLNRFHMWTLFHSILHIPAGGYDALFGLPHLPGDCSKVLDCGTCLQHSLRCDRQEVDTFRRVGFAGNGRLPSPCIFNERWQRPVRVI